MNVKKYRLFFLVMLSMLIIPIQVSAEESASSDGLPTIEISEVDEESVNSDTAASSIVSNEKPVEVRGISVISEWGTNYDMRIAVGGHGIHNQPYGLAGTVTYGNTSNHINKTVQVTYAKLLSNNETYYRYQMDGNTYWTNYKAFGSRTTQHDAVVKLAEECIGIPYLWGGNTPAGFDCSGLVQYVYKTAVNINLPRVTTGQETTGREVGLNSLQKGDLLFWGQRGGTDHVAIYIGNNQFIHAPRPGMVVEIVNMNSYRPAFARRILPDI
jgi:cell wall-associated NlpC family hydrolase